MSDELYVIMIRPDWRAGRGIYERPGRAGGAENRVEVYLG